MTTITKRIAKAFLTIAITGIILIPQTIHAANNQSQNVIPRSWITEVSYDVDDVVFVDLRPYLK